jgi:hypothetical protein
MSQKLHLDFIDVHPFAPSRFSFIGIVVLGLGIALIFFTLQQYQSISDKHHEVLLKLKQFNNQPKKETITRNVREEIPIEIKTQIKASVADLTIPWNEFLNAIEGADLKDVALLSLEPSIKKQQVILAGEAKNLHSVMQFIRRLEAQPILSQVYLQKHQLDEDNVSKPVRFTLVARLHTFNAN